MEWWEKMLEGDTDEFQNEQFDKRLVLVVYDIVNDKRRRNMVKHLESFGYRVQKSAFEFMLDDAAFNRLINKLPFLINEKEDLLRVYRLSQHCHLKCWGSVMQLKESNYWIV